MFIQLIRQKMGKGIDFIGTFPDDSGVSSDEDGLEFSLGGGEVAAFGAELAVLGELIGRSGIPARPKRGGATLGAQSSPNGFGLTWG